MNRPDLTLETPDIHQRRNWIITGSEVVRGRHDGPIHVRDGGSVTIEGTHDGPLHVDRRSTATIRGTHNGPIHVGSTSHVTVLGDHTGLIQVAQGARLTVEKSGRVNGELHLHGILDNHGERTGLVRGQGSIRTHAGSTAGSGRDVGNDHTP